MCSKGMWLFLGGKQGDVDDVAKTRKWKKALMGMHYWQENKVTSFLKDGEVLVRGGNGNCEKKTWDTSGFQFWWRSKSRVKKRGVQSGRWFSPVQAYSSQAQEAMEKLIFSDVLKVIRQKAWCYLYRVISRWESSYKCVIILWTVLLDRCSNEMKNNFVTHSNQEFSCPSSSLS